jgi:hypothetical protein
MSLEKVAATGHPVRIYDLGMMMLQFEEVPGT